jgi:hypothetical protein
VARKSQEMVVVHPDYGDKEIAHRVAYHRRPQRQKCREGRLRRRLEFQHHNCDDYSEHAVRERSQSFWRRSSMVMHTVRGSDHQALWNAAGNSINDRNSDVGLYPPMGRKSFLLTDEPKPTIAQQSLLL